MVTVPLGIGAYKRAAAGEPEIKLVNRFVEKSIVNQREHVTLLSRFGTNSLAQFAPGQIRANYSKRGLFDGDLFVVSGTSLYRYSRSTGATTAITGTVGGTGFVYATWQKGIGYERLFISDGVNLQYYNTHAMGLLTLTLAAADGNITSQVIDINGTYYSWSATVDPGTTPDGTSAHPYLALLGTADATTGTTADSASLANMVLLLNYSGIPGYNFSQSVPGANVDVTATSTDTTLTLTAIVDGTAGNAVTTSVFSGAHLAFGAATLAGGGGSALVNVPMGVSGEAPKALASVSSFVLVSVANTPKFEFLQPGAVTIDPLDYAEKESNPDNILDMLTVGDQVMISGNGSAESWYATGDLDLPFAPQEGRVYRRGVVEGTPVAVKESVIFVSDDGKVYQIGYKEYSPSMQYGDLQPISDHGIEERIRTQLRRLQGLTP